MNRRAGARVAPEQGAFAFMRDERVGRAWGTDAEREAVQRKLDPPAAPVSGVRARKRKSDAEPAHKVPKDWGELAGDGIFGHRGELLPGAEIWRPGQPLFDGRGRVFGDEAIVRARLAAWFARREGKAPQTTEERKPCTCTRCHKADARWDEQGQRWRWCVECTEARSSAFARRDGR